MSYKIKCIIKRPDEKYGHVTNISPRLENLQKTVEGYIETVPAVGGAIILCNEEGKLRGLENNMPYEKDYLVRTALHDEFDDIPIDLATWKRFVDDQASGRNIYE